MGVRKHGKNGPKLGSASKEVALRCAALRWRWSMPVRVRTDDQDQPNRMVLSALEEARYARLPSYGYEDHGSVLSPPIPNLYRWKSRDVKHGKKSMVPNICNPNVETSNTLAKA